MLYIESDLMKLYVSVGMKGVVKEFYEEKNPEGVHFRSVKELIFVS